MARLWEQIMATQVQKVHDEVDLGVILNLHYRTWNNLIEKGYDQQFLDAGGTFPDDKDPVKQYTGKKFITCIPGLDQVKPGEPLRIKALIMGEVNDPTLYFREMGGDTFSSKPMQHDARGVYRATIPGQKKDFEWYVTAETSLGNVIFPSTAGADDPEKMYQTVVVAKE